jgi:hypothetical protein
MANADFLKATRLVEKNAFKTDCEESLEHLQPWTRRGPRQPFFTSGRRKTALLRPRFLVFVQIWIFIHPASLGHPRPPGARSGSPEESNARETPRKVPMRLVAPTCPRERPVVVLIASSSAGCKSLRRRTCSFHAARRVNARPSIYRGLPRVWPHSPPPSP